MGNQCPCFHPNNKNAGHYALLEEKNGTIITESNDNKDVKSESNQNKLTHNGGLLNGVNSFGPPTLASNTMGANSPMINNNNIKSFDDDIAEQMRQSQNNNIEIYIKNEGEIEEKETFKKKVKLDDFTILKVLGRGAFGKVFLVERKDNKKLYAMKVLKKEDIEKRNQKLHTMAERQILENMDCPFVVKLHFAFQSSDKLYLVMDFMRGGEMFFHLRKSKKFEEKRAKLYAAELILALEYLHKRNIIYRDLKPENILLDYDGHIKIADFGLSKQGIAFGEKSYTFCGTPEYLAPEILLGLGHDKAADWWSFGALLYEMLSGAPPFYSKDKNLMLRNRLEKPIPMKPFFSPEASSILQALLCLDPDKRLGSSCNDAEEIKKHPFFNDIDWEYVKDKAYEPPFKPRFLGKKDLNNFDPMFTKEEAQDTPGEQNMSKSNYPDFTYQEKVGNESVLAASKMEDSEEIMENPAFDLKRK